MLVSSYCRLQRGTLSRHLEFSVGEALPSLVLCPQVLDALVSGLLVSCSKLRKTFKLCLGLPSQQHELETLHAVSGQRRALLTRFLSLTVTDGRDLLFRVLSAIGLYSLFSFSIIPDRRVNPVCVPPPLEAEVSPHCGFDKGNYQRFSIFLHVESSDLVDDTCSELSVHLGLIFPLRCGCLFLGTSNMSLCVLGIILLSVYIGSC